MLTDTLRVFGLTDNEARAYVALLRFGQQTPATTAPRARLSRGRVYQVLGELCRKGFAREIPGRVRSFAPVEPRVALGGILQERQARVEETAGLLDTLSAALESVGAPTPSPLPAIEVLRRPEHIALRFQQLQQEAEWEILVFVKAPRVGGASNPAEREALRRGVRMAGIYERALLSDPEYVAELRGFAEEGEEARAVDVLPMKLAVFDRRQALMPVASTHDPALPFTPVIVHDPGLAAVLGAAFDHIWGTAQTIRWKEIERVGSAQRKAVGQEVTG